jgi:hypothetical protein
MAWGVSRERHRLMWAERDAAELLCIPSDPPPKPWGWDAVNAMRAGELLAGEPPTRCPRCGAWVEFPAPRVRRVRWWRRAARALARKGAR